MVPETTPLLTNRLTQVTKSYRSHHLTAVEAPQSVTAPVDLTHPFNHQTPYAPRAFATTTSTTSSSSSSGGGGCVSG